MSWLKQAQPAASPLEAYFGWRPELMEQFKSFYGTLWDDALIEPALLEMVRLRIAQIHGCSAELASRHTTCGFSNEKFEALSHWRNSDLFDERECALLAYAEQIPFAHTAISDEDAARVVEAIGEADYVAFSVAIGLFDALCRVKMVMHLPEGAKHPGAPPASEAGVLH